MIFSFLVLFSTLYLFLSWYGRAGSRRSRTLAYLLLVSVVISACRFYLKYLHGGGSVQEVTLDQLARIKHFDDFWRVGSIRITIPPDWETKREDGYKSIYGLRAGPVLSDGLNGDSLLIGVEPLVGALDRNKCAELSEPMQKLFAGSLGRLPQGGEMVASRMGSIDTCRFSFSFSHPKFGSMRMVLYATYLQEPRAESCNYLHTAISPVRYRFSRV